MVIDDFYAVSVEDAALAHVEADVSAGQNVKRPKAVERLEKANKAYEEAGLLGSPHKDLCDVEKGKIMGAEIDGSAYARGLGLTTVARPAQRRLALAYVSLSLASRSYYRCTSCLFGWRLDQRFALPSPLHVDSAEGLFL